jgi:hypothetical protein
MPSIKHQKRDNSLGPTFTGHAGNEILQKQIESGLSESENKSNVARWFSLV